MIRVDGAVFAAAQAGDPVAIDRLLRELQPDIRRYARRQCHRATAIEDVVQEALIVLYRRLGNVRDPLAVAGWIFRVVTRLCMLPVLALIRGAEELTERHEPSTSHGFHAMTCASTSRARSNRCPRCTAK